jgi:hypothetical protein
MKAREFKFFVYRNYLYLVNKGTPKSGPIVRIMYYLN